MKIKINTNTELIKGIQGLKDARLQVGWFEDSKYEDGTPIANVAFWQEYGTSRGIPMRPFMRPAEFNNKEKWVNLFAQEIKKAIQSKKNVKDAMEVLGLVVQGDIQNEISMVFNPPLKDSTIKARLRRRKVKKITASLTKPLIDTGMMFDSVQHKVEEC